MFLPFVHIEEKKKKDESCKKSTKKAGLMSSAKQTLLENTHYIFACTMYVHVYNIHVYNHTSCIYA